VVSLLERIELEQARREARRRPRMSSPELRLGALQKQCLRGRRRLAALDGEPPLECRARSEGHPFEQLAGERFDLVPFGETHGSQPPQIDLGTRPERQLHRIALESARLLERLPELGEAPSQGAQRIVGFGEEQLCELPPTRRLTAEEQISQKRPRLVPARSCSRLTIAIDARRSEQPNPERHASSYIGLVMVALSD
jgi:hypothetical protein